MTSDGLLMASRWPPD